MDSGGKFSPARLLVASQDADDPALDGPARVQARIVGAEVRETPCQFRVFLRIDGVHTKPSFPGGAEQRVESIATTRHSG